MLGFALFVSSAPPVGYCPHTAIVYNRATTKVLVISVYLYFEYHSTATEWGQYPSFRASLCFEGTWRPFWFRRVVVGWEVGF